VVVDFDEPRLNSNSSNEVEVFKPAANSDPPGQDVDNNVSVIAGAESLR